MCAYMYVREPHKNMAFKKAARYRGLYIIPELKKGREA